MQLRHETTLAGEAYVSQQAWRTASLARCPLHPRDRCGLAKHTAYARFEPVGMVLAQLCEPSSELHIAEDWYRRTALEDLLDLPAERINHDRLYRALDRLLPHKQTIERYLVKRLRELFDLPYGLLLYDVTSTYFE